MTLAAPPPDRAHDPPRPGDRRPAAVRGFAGSWAFAAAMLAFPAAWVLLNVSVLLLAGTRPFDPHPYLLINLILSLLAALQAPVIIMASRRQARTERERAEHDDQMNLKVQSDITALHRKIDALRDRELADILAHQVELLQELRDRPRSTAA